MRCSFEQSSNRVWAELVFAMIAIGLYNYGKKVLGSLYSVVVWSNKLLWEELKI